MRRVLTESVMTRITLVLVAMLAVACDKQEKVYVECQQGLTGATCTVTHQEGDDPAEACWDFRIACANGASVSASACHSVSVGEKAMRNIPVEQERIVGDCDSAVSATVTVSSIKTR